MTTTQGVIAWGVATLLAVLVFLHANKRGSKHATPWGIGVFLVPPIVLPVYLFYSWRSKPSGPPRRY
jgi:hypothetical protein